MASLFKTVSGSAAEKDDDDARNRQRVLILSSRGVTFRQRHLLNDLVSMIPHGRKDAKLDTKSKLFHLNELAFLYNCNDILFFEARKRQDLYMWLSKAPNGPCVKFHLHNIHTMSELNFTGNALKGSRPILSFDATFDSTPSLALTKELLLQIFGVPPGARKSKPFVDRIVAFTVTDGKIWMRHYEIKEAAVAAGDDETEKTEDGMSLVEIGPRFVMTPIVMLEGSFGGPVVYENKEFVSPNAVRSALRKKRAVKAGKRDDQKVKRGVKRKDLEREVAAVKQTDLDDAVLFG